MEDVRTIKCGLYRDLCELCMLLEEAWNSRNVQMVKVCIDKAKLIAAELRKGE